MVVSPLAPMPCWPLNAKGISAKTSQSAIWRKRWVIAVSGRFWPKTQAQRHRSCGLQRSSGPIWPKCSDTVLEFVCKTCSRTRPACARKRLHRTAASLMTLCLSAAGGACTWATRPRLRQHRAFQLHATSQTSWLYSVKARRPLWRFSRWPSPRSILLRAPASPERRVAGPAPVLV